MKHEQKIMLNKRKLRMMAKVKFLVFIASAFLFFSSCNDGNQKKNIESVIQKNEKENNFKDSILIKQKIEIDSTKKTELKNIFTSYIDSEKEDIVRQVNDSIVIVERFGENITEKFLLYFNKDLEIDEYLLFSMPDRDGEEDFEYQKFNVFGDTLYEKIIYKEYLEDTNDTIYEYLLIRNNDIIEIKKDYQKDRKFFVGSERLLSPSFFKNLRDEDLRIFRNEIFATYGYDFSSKDLRDYFLKYDWYKPINKNIFDKLTLIERYNINLAKKEEKSR